MQRSKRNSPNYWRSAISVFLLAYGLATYGQPSWSIGEKLEANYSGFHSLTSLEVHHKRVHFGLGLVQNWSQNYVEHMQMGLASSLMLDLGGIEGRTHRLGLAERSEWPLPQLSVHQIFVSSAHGWALAGRWSIAVQMGYGLVWERTASYLSNRHKRAGMLNLGCAYTFHI